MTMVACLKIEGGPFDYPEGEWYLFSVEYDMILPNP